MQVKEMGNDHFPLLCIEENPKKNQRFTEIEELAFQNRVDILYYLYLKTYDSRGVVVQSLLFCLTDYVLTRCMKRKDTCIFHIRFPKELHCSNYV